MTFEELSVVNKDIKLTPIKGKDYAEVQERIKAFRKIFPNGSITTDIVSMSGDPKTRTVVMKTTVRNEFGDVLSTGFAYEDEANGMVNKTSFIENCETSAVGRALGMLGIGDTAVASAEEVEHAIQIQTANSAIDQVKQKALVSMLANAGIDVKDVLPMYKISDVSQVTERIHENIVSHVADIKARLEKDKA